MYPDTAVCWEPALTASAWLSGSDGRHKKISLKPKDMTPGVQNSPWRLNLYRCGAARRPGKSL